MWMTPATIMLTPSVAKIGNDFLLSLMYFLKFPRNLYSIELNNGNFGRFTGWIVGIAWHIVQLVTNYVQMEHNETKKPSTCETLGFLWSLSEIRFHLNCSMYWQLLAFFLSIDPQNFSVNIITVALYQLHVSFALVLSSMSSANGSFSR